MVNYVGEILWNVLCACPGFIADASEFLLYVWLSLILLRHLKKVWLENLIGHGRKSVQNFSQRISEEDQVEIWNLSNALNK